MQSHIKFCDARAIRFDLEQGNVINKGQRERMDNVPSVDEANTLLYQYLRNDPAVETLQSAASVLKDAPNTTGTNKGFAREIVKFLFPQ